MTPYLRQHKPARSQYRSPRRQRPTGLTVVHTAESILDTVGPDTGAENVADFIRRRAEPGSYHDLADSDSNLQLVRYEDEAYQDGTGSNPFALSISFALKAADWTRLSAARRAAFLRQGALAFARQQKWLRDHGHPTTPLRLVTRAQSAHGAAGFIAHGTRDPGRRSDPGAGFPWQEWFAACRAATTAPKPTPAPAPVQEDDMPIIARGSGSKKYLTDLATFKRWIRSGTTVNTLTRNGVRQEQDDALDPILAVVPDAADLP